MKIFLGIIIKSTLIGLVYTIGIVVIGGLLSYVAGNIPITVSQSPLVLLLTNFISGFLIGLTLGTVARYIKTSRKKSIFIWTTAIFLNVTSVIIEGAFFAPKLLPLAWVLRILFQYFLLAIIVGIFVDLLFSYRGMVIQKYERPHRSFLSLVFCFFISAFSYLLFYFVFGSLNYQLFTETYYHTHRSLSVPESKTIIIVETIRAVLIILSIVPLLTSINASKKKQALICGLVLFVIGGVVPLLMQVNMLPTPLLIASGVEIFFQNFFTGIVAALMLGTPLISNRGKRS